MQIKRPQGNALWRWKAASVAMMVVAACVMVGDILYLALADGPRSRFGPVAGGIVAAVFVLGWQLWRWLKTLSN